MKYFSLIFLFILLISCRQEQRPDKSFFIGEWVSDSLVPENGKQWREFLFIDSLGNFTRTTWWNEKYILTINAHVDGLTIIDKSGKLFDLTIIDSNQIVLKNQKYYGKFYNNSWPRHFDNKYLNKFISGEHNKELLKGGWTFKKAIVPDTGQNSSFEKIYVQRFSSQEFLSHKINSDLKLFFSADNMLKVISANDTSEYNIIVDSSSIELIPLGHDYIISWKISLRGDSLNIDQRTNAIQTIMTFVKTE